MFICIFFYLRNIYNVNDNVQSKNETSQQIHVKTLTWHTQYEINLFIFFESVVLHFFRFVYLRFQLFIYF